MNLFHNYTNMQKAIRSLAKGYLPISLNHTIKTEGNPSVSKGSAD